VKFDTYLAIGIGGFIGAILRAYTAGIINILYFNHHFNLNFLFKGAEAQAGNLISEGACMLKRVPLCVFVAHV